MRKSDELKDNMMAESRTFWSPVTNILARRPRLRSLIRRLSVRYGGENHKEFERFLKFVFVGITGTIVDLGLTNFLMAFVFHVNKDNGGTLIPVASTIGFIVAVSNNFIWNRYWTYPDSRSHPISHQLGQFFVVNAFGWLIRVLIVALLSTPFTQLIGSLPENLLRSLSISKNFQAIIGGDMAVLAAIAVVMIWNFFVNRYWTYNDVK